MSMPSALNGKHIIVGITGGIAAYKTATLVRLLKKAGAEVQVIMTPAAKEFITPLTLSTLSRNPVISEFFTANTGVWNSHVDLALWADAMIIAPATASTMAKMANGVADNMLVTSYLSSRSQVFIAPAMDLDMMAHPTTVENIGKLKSYGNIIIEPEKGELASGLEGKGRMAEPETILDIVEHWFSHRGILEGKKIMITAGPTYENIDPVRFIGNYSSGKMGYALAEAAAAMGAAVTLVSGPVSIKCKNPHIDIIHVVNGRDMADICEKIFPHTDIAVMAAAVSDYRPECPSESKIKREQQDTFELRLVKNPDIAASLGKIKRENQKLIGFALETDNEKINALGKMARKNLDAIILNSLNDQGAGFGVDTNKVSIFFRNGKEADFDLMDKTHLAFRLWETLHRQLICADS